MARAIARARSAWRCASLALTLRRKQTSQRGLGIHLQAHAADILRQRRGAGQLRLRLRVGFLREQSLAAPAPRARLELAQAVRLGDREQFVRVRPAAARVAAASAISANPSIQRTIR